MSQTVAQALKQHCITVSCLLRLIQKTRDVDLMLNECWVNVADSGPTLTYISENHRISTIMFYMEIIINMFIPTYIRVEMRLLRVTLKCTCLPEQCWTNISGVIHVIQQMCGYCYLRVSCMSCIVMCVLLYELNDCRIKLFLLYGVIRFLQLHTCFLHLLQ